MLAGIDDGPRRESRFAGTKAIGFPPETGIRTLRGVSAMRLPHVRISVGHFLFAIALIALNCGAARS